MMNEQKLNEIVEQTIAQNESDWPHFRGALTGSGSLYLHVFAEKFAELIVGECMELALAEQKRYANITHRNMSECAVALGNFSLLMKDHFEDEE